MIFTNEEYKLILKKVQKMMQEKGIELLISHDTNNLNYLTAEKDFVCVNLNRNIFQAKKKVLQLSENYMPPNQKVDIQVLGRAGISTLYSAINEYKLAGYMSDYDVVIARKIANVICGGDLTSNELVSEKYLLNLEREAFLSLLGNQKTIDRIQYLLLNNKPLRN